MGVFKCVCFISHRRDARHFIQGMRICDVDFGVCNGHEWRLTAVGGRKIVSYTEVVGMLSSAVVVATRPALPFFLRRRKWITSTIWAPCWVASGFNFVLAVFCRTQCVLPFIYDAWIVRTTCCGALAADYFGRLPCNSSTILEIEPPLFACLPCDGMQASLSLVHRAAVVFSYRLIFLPSSAFYRSPSAGLLVSGLLLLH